MRFVCKLLEGCLSNLGKHASVTQFEWLGTRILLSNSLCILLQVGQLAFELSDVEVLPDKRKDSLSVRLKPEFDQTDAIRVS